MAFHEEKLPEFFGLFESVREKIAGFEGCRELKIYSDIRDKSIIFTYSVWTSEAALNKYRDSELFKSTWQSTKKLFKSPPQAWSVEIANTKYC